MEISFREENGVHIIDVSGEFDLANAPKARALFDQLIKKQAKQIVVNFNEATYIASSGLATVIDVFQRSRKFQGRLVLCGLAPVVKNVFEIARLDSVFTIFLDEAGALESFK
ncbi:MAG: STAS domain-containing protein [Verrucomicrobiota bacterium]|nr:STAS domain-containing protein [Verrucomicrobiota bacterium]